MEKNPATETVELQQPSSSRQSSTNSFARKRTAEEQEKWEKDQYIFVSAIQIAVEYASAINGQLPSEDNLEALYKNGYVDYSPEEIMRVTQCEGSTELQSLIQSYCEDDLAERQGYEFKVLDEILSDRSKGLLPDKLFMAILKNKSFQQLERESNGDKSRWDRAILLDIEIPPAEKITRYKRWQLVEQLVHFSEDEDAQKIRDRKLNIVLGVNVRNEAVLSSFQSEIIKSNSSLSVDDVELAAVGPDFDYIFPDIRQRMLEDIRRAGTPIPPVELPDPNSYYDTKTRKFLTPKQAEQAPKNRRENIRKLGELLLDQSVKLDSLDRNPLKYHEWRKKDYIRYGKWLLDILKPHDREVTARIIRHAHQLFDQGPSEHAIEASFEDGIYGFHAAIDRPKEKKGRFSHWEFDDWAWWIDEIAEENNGEVSGKIIRQRTKDGKSGPTWKMVKNIGGFEQFLKAKGRRTYQERVDLEVCVIAGVKYAQNNGVIPGYKDVMTSGELPSTNSIYKYCESIPNFKKLVAERLASTDNVELLAVA